jgi:hypothetical protein
MTFVGPRPESTQFEDMFVGKYSEILERVPGIFGPNQIAFRNECEWYSCEENPEAFYREVLFPRKAECDLEYFSKATFLTNIGLVLKSLLICLIGIVNWGRFIRLYSKVLMLEILFIAAAWIGANVLYFSGLPEGANFAIVTQGTLIFPPLLLIAMFIGGCYRHPIKYFSFYDARRLAITVAVSWSVIFMLFAAFHPEMSFSLGPITLFILLTLLPLPRVFFRIAWQSSNAEKLKPEKSILIYGTGQAGRALANCIGNGNLIGFLDDDPDLKGKRIQGIRILGYESDIPAVYQVQPFEQLWVTFRPNASKRARLKEICEDRNITLIILPEVEPFGSFPMGSLPIPVQNS